MNASSQTPNYNFMKYRIHKILLVCCSYDGYILEEDGHIESLIFQEYYDLNMSNAPSFTRVSSATEALELLSHDDSFDFVLTMYNAGELDVFTFAKIVKKQYPNTPVALLTSFSKDIYRRIAEQDQSGFDYIFSWHGNTDLIIAIIKLIEDKMNAAEDIVEGGVQAILLVEDSIRFYSTYLPEIYKILLLQNSELLKDSLNEKQQILRKRARPKILLATNYADAVELYMRYRNNLLGVISDVGFALHKDAPQDTEKQDAGIDLCHLIKEDNPLMPVILQSSQTDYAEVAKTLGVNFLAKNSKNLLQELQEYITTEFAFGDLLLRDTTTGEVIGTAKDLRQLENLLATIPEESFNYHTSQNHLSKWLYSRGLFPLAASIRQLNRNQFKNTEEHRTRLVNLIRDYRRLLGQGVVAKFDAESYNDSVAFARIGDGSLGGKARGLAFMNSMLNKYNEYDKYPNVRINIPRTVVIATQYFDEFFINNGLQYVVSQDLSDEEILSEFVSSTLPAQLRYDLQAYVATLSSPVAVRSSSKLEDSHYQPFAGIYSTYMVPYIDNPDQMHRLLSKAIKSVYASVYFAASRSYIQTSQNLVSEEKMGVIIQQVSGTAQNDLFMPTFSGVARSTNHYPIGNELSSEGICNIAMGLGKLVVDGGKTLRFSPHHPKAALQTSTDQLALSNTQTEVLALSLHPEEFRTSTNDAINIKRLSLPEIAQIENSKYVCSTWDRPNGRLSESPFTKGNKVITFNKILKYDSFPLASIIIDILKMGCEEMRCEVEVEFAVNMNVKNGEPQQFDLLQIRPIIDTNLNHTIDWSKVDTTQSIIYSEMALGKGKMGDIQDIVYLKLDKFDRLRTREMADELLKINNQMVEQERGYVLVGAGRWGSSDPFLGVPVSWNHISQARVIVECGLKDFDIEPSQGTHFFQNVTSLGVGYMTINPHRGEGLFNQQFLDSLEAEGEGEFIRWVRTPKPLNVYIDGKLSRGVVTQEESHEE